MRTYMIVFFKEIEEKRLKFSGRYEPTTGGRFASTLPSSPCSSGLRPSMRGARARGELPRLASQQRRT